MRTLGFFICLPLLFLPPSVEADIYRCEGDFGEPSYRQQPCGDDSVVEVQQAPVAAGQATGLRSAERAWLEQRRRTRSRAANKGRRDRVSPAVSEKKAEAQAHRCRSKRRSLDAVRAKLRRGYKAASGERLRRRRRAYEDYLATFCS